jgi:20S proteasome subunit beta 6
VATQLTTFFFNFILSKITERFSGETLELPQIVPLVSQMIYNRRFNSCVDINVLGAIDVNGYGAVFNYDELGRFNRVAYAVEGVEARYIEDYMLSARRSGLGRYDIVEILKDAFISATARELETGEQVEFLIIDNNGVQRIMQDL